MSDVNIGDEAYRLSIFGHNVEVTKPIREYIVEKLHKIEHFTDLLIDVMVRLDVQKLDHKCELVLKFSHFKVVTHADTTDMYASIDKAFVKLQAKLRRWKGRIQSHHAKIPQQPTIEKVSVNVFESEEEALEEINDQIEEQNLNSFLNELPKIAKSKSIPLKMLRTDEAIMKMELSHDHFMLYRCEEDQKLKVIYRRRDGSYGVIAAEESAVS
ncbi:MAG: ribosome-associated translation inhibitor RaiA [Simkaniaceae bacterium]